MTTKRFKGYRLTQPVVIELESPDGERTLTVECVRSLPGSIFLELASVVKFNEEGEVAVDEATAAGAAAGVILKVLKMAVLPEQWDDFKKFIDDPDNGVTVELLSEIAGYLSEQYTGANPQTAPSS